MRKLIIYLLSIGLMQSVVEKSVAISTSSKEKKLSDNQNGLDESLQTDPIVTSNTLLPKAKRSFNKKSMDESQNILNILTGRSPLDNLEYKIKNAIVVMGSPDSGKDILIQLISGHGGKLISVESPQEPGTFILINEDAKRAHNVSEWYPTITKDASNNNISYLEFPGFVLSELKENDYDVKHDIVSAYFKRRLIEITERLKLVCVFDYTSILHDVGKVKLTLLEFLKSLENKFEPDSVALVITNVDEKEKSVKKKIANTVRKVLKELKTEKKNFKLALSLEKIFLTNNKDEYPKIGILWQPTQPGRWNESVAYNSTKNALTTLIHKNIEYASDPGNFFKTSLKAESFYAVCDLIHLIEKNIDISNGELYGELKQYFKSLIDGSNDIFKLKKEFKEISFALLKVKKDNKKSISLVDTVGIISRTIPNLNSSILQEPIAKITKYHQILKYLKIFDNTCNFKVADIASASDDDENSYLLENFFDATYSEKIFDYLVDLKNGYEKLTEVFDYFFNSMNKFIAGFENPYSAVRKLCTSNNSEFDVDCTINIFTEKIKDRFLIEAFQEINDMQNSDLKEKLKPILSYLFMEPEIEQNDITNRIVVKGNIVFLSAVPRMKGKTRGKVEIYAREKFYVDSNYFGAAQISVVAPVWEVPKDHYIYEINLNGVNGEPLKIKKANDGYKPGYSGDNGKPGNPGGPGGNFFGIYNEFKEGSRLHVSLRGGDGSTGQDGGDGQDGQNTYDPIILTNKDWTIGNSSCDDPVTKFYSISFVRTTNCTFKRDCNDGGNGGNGGMGGRPGSGGSLKVLPLTESSNERDKILLYTDGGSYGASGKAGTNGKASIPRVKQVYQEITSSIEGRYTPYRLIVNKSKICADGKPGSLPVKPTETTHNENSFDPFPSDIVNSFKFHVRNDSYRVRETFLNDFIDKLAKDKRVLALTSGPLSFVNEFIDLEYLFRSDEPDRFMNAYESLRNRIEDYMIHEETKEPLIHYLKAALISKISNIVLRPDDFLIIDPKPVLDDTLNEVKLYQEQQSLNITSQIFDSYNASLQKNLNEAQDYIAGTVTDDMIKTFKKIDLEVKNLINQVYDLRDTSMKERDYLEAKQKQLSKEIVLKKLVNIAKFAAAAIGVFCSGGAAAGAMIGGASMIIENSDSESGIPSEHVKLPGSVKDAIRKVTDINENQRSLFENQLNGAERILNNLNGENTPGIEDIKNEIRRLKGGIKKQTRKRHILDPEFVDSLYEKRKYLDRLMAKELELIKQEGVDTTTPKNTEPTQEEKDLQVLEKIKKYLGVAKKIFSLYDAGVSTVQKIEDDDRQLDVLVNATKLEENKIKDLNTFERKITSKFMISIKKIQDDLSSRLKNMESQSQASLDISQWQVETELDEFKEFVELMTKDFKNHDDFIECVKRLRNGMSVTTKLYERIAEYRNRVSLAAFETDLSNAKIDANIASITDSDLRNKVIKLNLIILSNVIIKRYESAFNAFKLRIFPLAYFFLRTYEEEFSITSFNTVSNSSTNSLMQEAIRRIEDMRSQLAVLKAHPEKYSYYIHPNVKFDKEEDLLRPPFYIWEYESLRLDLPDLFSGQEVVMDAHVTQALPIIDAVKFNTIDIHFKLKNKTLQTEFDKILGQVMVFATHFGNSRYKVCDKYYSISTSPARFEFTIEKDAKGDPTNSNEYYQDTRDGKAELSPYATWKFRVNFTTRSYNFDSFDKFKHEPMSLVLTGRGQYVDSDSLDICNYQKMDRFYTLIHEKSL